MTDWRSYVSVLGGVESEEFRDALACRHLSSQWHSAEQHAFAPLVHQWALVTFLLLCLIEIVLAGEVPFASYMGIIIIIVEHTVKFWHLYKYTFYQPTLPHFNLAVTLFNAFFAVFIAIFMLLVCPPRTTTCSASWVVTSMPPLVWIFSFLLFMTNASHAIVCRWPPPENE
jgi:hypothetical protein